MFSSFFAAAGGASAEWDEAETLPPCAKGVARHGREASNTSTRSPSSVGSNSPVIEAPVVRNTFIDLPVGRPLSMDDDFLEREIGSCPASGIRAPPGLIPFPRMPSFDAPCSPVPSPELAHAFPLAYWPRTMSGECLEDFLTSGQPKLEQLPYGELTGGLAKPTLWPRTMSGDVLELLAEAAAAVQQPYFSSAYSGSAARSFPGAAGSPHWPVAEQDWLTGLLPPPPAESAPAIQPSREAPPPPQAAPCGVLSTVPGADTPAPPGAWAAAAVPLNLAAALDSQSEPGSHEVESELGSAAMPTVGSAGHSFGTCKPCAFFHIKGCGNGVNCPFCHLCDAGEKRRRQKDRKQMLRGW